MIHVLSATEAGAIVAEAFTRGNDASIFRSAAFEVLRAQGSGPPLLSGRGIVKVLRCRLREGPSEGLIDIGDHVLVLGDVLGIIEPPTKRRSTKGGERTVLFGSGVSKGWRSYQIRKAEIHSVTCGLWTNYNGTIISTQTDPS